MIKKIIVFIVLLSSCADQSGTNSATKQIMPDSPIVKTEAPEQISGDTVETIYFEGKSTFIAEKYKLRLKEIAKLLAADSIEFMKIVGFTDTIGTERFNEELAEKRVNNVYSILHPEMKVDENKFYLQWMGESGEVYDLHFEPVHPHQNCVDIYIQWPVKSK